MAAMSLPIVFRRAARQEYDAAADWYEARRPGLGVTFTHAVQRALDEIAHQPDFFAAVWNDVRESLVRGFPYCVYYREELDRILVLAVFHTARNPSIWKGRS